MFEVNYKTKRLFLGMFYVFESNFIANNIIFIISKIKNINRARSLIASYIVMKDLFYLDKNRSALFKKYKIYVDVSNVNENFEPSQKLNSFFGQVGVYEGHDKIIKIINTLVKTNNTNFYFFDQNEDFEDSLESEEFSDEEVIVGIDDFFLQSYKINFEQLKVLEEVDENEFSNDEYFDDDIITETLEEKNLDTENTHLDSYDEDDEEEDALEENDLKSIYYIPLFIFFFFGEKRVNFLTLFSYRKKFYFEIQKIINCLNLVNLKEKEFNLFKSFRQFSILKSYSNLISVFKKIFRINKNYYNLLNLNSIDFFKSDNFLWPWYKQILEVFQRRDKRMFIFKKILNKKYFQINLSLKKMRWISSFYLFYITIYKGFWYANKFKHQDLLSLQISSLSQIHSIKKKILKKFKRRKRYKKKITRSFFGSKFIYDKVFNIIEEKKKKKKR